MKILSVYWHNVVDDLGSPEHLDIVSPTLAVFREHLRFLTANYILISAEEFLWICQDARLIRSYKKPPVLLGFDDGFKNVIRYALPILEEFKAPAVLFVIGEILRNPDFVPWYVEVKHLIRRAVKSTVLYGDATINLSLRQDRLKLRRLFDASFRACESEAERQQLLLDLAALLRVDRPKGIDLDEDQEFASPKDLGNLGCASLLTVASHTMTHPYLATLTYEQQINELEKSHLLLRQHCPSYCPIIAYPLGSFNKDTITIARHVYKAGFATFIGSSYRNLHAYPRIGLGRSSVEELAYAISSRRLNCILPLKKLLHVTGIRRAGNPLFKRGRRDHCSRIDAEVKKQL